MSGGIYRKRKDENDSLGQSNFKNDFDNGAGDDLGAERWARFYSKLEQEIPRQFFQIFFNDLGALEWTDDRLVLTSSDEKILSHLKNRYMQVITNFAREVSNSDLNVQFKLSSPRSAGLIRQDQRENQGKKNSRSRITDESQLNFFDQGVGQRGGQRGGQGDAQSNGQGNAQNNTENNGQSYTGGGLSVADNGRTYASEKNYINPNYTFERFVKGPSNEYAYMAALGTAENPKKFHNPLYLFGGVGLGKTHLMMAIANSINRNFPWMKVLYVPSEAFQSDIVEAVQKKTWAAYQSKYRNADILLIDDIQFISERAEYTQEQIFHTFNHLYQNNKQIVISGDRPPQQLATLKDRLISRFQSGLIVDIKPPNLETREAILMTKSKEMEIDMPVDVARFIANHEKNQVRLLEAALIKLKFSSTLKGRKIDMELAKEVLRELSMEQRMEISVQDIIEVVSQSTGIRKEEILGKSRQENIVLARHIAMYLSRKFIQSLTLLNVAYAFGRNDHTTVLNAEKNIKMKMEVDIAFQEKMEKLIEVISSKTV